MNELEGSIQTPKQNIEVGDTCIIRYTKELPPLYQDIVGDMVVVKSIGTSVFVSGVAYQCYMKVHPYNTVIVKEENLLKIDDQQKEEKSLDKHYKYSYKGIKIDPYRIFKIYSISDPAQQHAIKKLLRAGNSIKSLKQDIQEVIMTLNRWVEMIEEDEK